MSITGVPGLPLKAGRHLAAWIVWHTARVSMIEDIVSEPETPEPRKRSRRRSKK